MHIQPYLFFDGRCEQAIDFYKKAIGAQVQMLMRFKDSPQPPQGASVDPEKVMHSQVRVGETTLLQSLWRVAGGDDVTVHVQLLPAVASVGAERRALSESLRARIGVALDQAALP